MHRITCGDRNNSLNFWVHPICYCIHRYSCVHTLFHDTFLAFIFKLSSFQISPHSGVLVLVQFFSSLRRFTCNDRQTFEDVWRDHFAYCMTCMICHDWKQSCKVDYTAFQRENNLGGRTGTVEPARRSGPMTPPFAVTASSEPHENPSSHWFPFASTDVAPVSGRFLHSTWMCLHRVSHQRATGELVMVKQQNCVADTSGAISPDSKICS